jgi:hypothetical protein
MKKKQSLNEFVEWFVDNRVGKALTLEPWQQRMYSMIAEANVHTGLYGCPIVVIKGKGFNWTWKCGAEECPGERPIDTRFGIIQPKATEIDKVLPKKEARD